MADDDLTAALEEIRERAKGPMRKFRDIDASQADVDILLRCVEAVLKLTGELEAMPYPDGADVTRDQLPVEVARTDIARGLGHIFREAISRELTGKEDSDGHD